MMEILARPTQNLIQHISNMIYQFDQEFQNSFQFKLNYLLIPKESKINSEILCIFKNTFHYFLILHDFGKFNPWFQQKVGSLAFKNMDKKINQFYSYHSQLGVLGFSIGKKNFITWVQVQLNITSQKYPKFKLQINELMEKFQEIFEIFMYSINFHHERHLLQRDMSNSVEHDSGFTYLIFNEILMEMKKYYGENLEKITIELNKIFLQIKSLNPELRVILEKTIAEFVKRKIDKDELWEIFDNINDSWDVLIQSKPNLFNIFQIYSLLCDLDEWDAKSHIDNYQEHTIPFSLPIVTTNLDLISKYRSIKYSPIKNNCSDELLLLKKKLWDKSNQVKFHEGGEILKIQYPTGSAKTFAYLHLALQKRNLIFSNLSFNPKIIYCLPFISITDQVGKDMWDILKLSEYFMKNFSKNISEIQDLKFTQNELLSIHHHLAERNWTYFAIPEKNQDNFQLARDSYDLWKSSFIITTFVAFWEGVISARKRNLLKFHRLMGSIIILDEIQNIPIRYWKTISVFIHFMTKYFGCTFIVGSATYPGAITKKYSETDQLTVPITEITCDYNNLKLDRYILAFVKEDILFSDLVNYIKKKIQLFEREPLKIMVVLNTRWAARYIFNICQIQFSDWKLVFLSSAMLYEDRLNSIQEIKSSSEKTLLICTQVIEAGVDLSFDLVIRDFAPLDSLIQVSGRCNRNNKIIGKVFIVKIFNDINQKKIERFYLIYDSIFLKTTEDLLIPDPILSESELYTKIERYYYMLSEKKNHKKKIDEGLNEFFSNNPGSLTKKFNLIEKSENWIFGFTKSSEEINALRTQFSRNLTQTNKSKKYQRLLSKSLKNTISITKATSQRIRNQIDQSEKIFYMEDHEQGILILPWSYFKHYYDHRAGLKVNWL